MTLRLSTFAFLLGLAACRASTPRPDATSPTGGAASARAPRPPRIVVAVVVDQLAAWIADERFAMLPRSGGFARLAREGTWIRELRYEHAITETAPGHAALFTGLPPERTGIVANEVRGPGGALQSVLRDASTRVIGPAGPGDRTSSSIAKLRVTTVADVVKKAAPDRLVVSLSLKDRGAIFGGGRTPDATLWFDASSGTFVTSTAFASVYPAWATAGDAGAVRAAIAADWIAPGLPAPPFIAPDDAAGEGDLEGFGTRFPHRFASARAPFEALRASPAGDALLVDLAHQAIGAATAAKRPLLLSLSLSSHDYVGHVFGPSSLEAWDELNRLDAQLARLMQRLDERVGREGWAMVLSADHGIQPTPEGPAQGTTCVQGRAPDDPRPCAARRRVSHVALHDALEAEAQKAFGPGKYIEAIVDPYLFLSPTAEKLPPRERARLVLLLVRWLEQDAGFLRAIDVRALPPSCPPASDERVEALVCRSVVRGEGGDLYLVPQPGVMFGRNYVDEVGSVHGTPYLHDRAVPLFVRAPSRIGAGETRPGPVGPNAYARTVADLLGVTWPAEARDRLLSPGATGTPPR